MTIRFDKQVAIVTGAGNGLGRSHAQALAERGAKVIVNDLGGERDGSGGSSQAAEAVVESIRSKGGEAIANAANVADMAQVQEMVDDAMQQWGRVDILVNNAGILRDKTFAKVELEDFRTVLDVHLMGSVHCSKAVWPIMQQQNYGRIVMTTSSSGLYGNFGQSNYAAAKMALVGLMNCMVLEGAKYNININSLSPAAGTRMLEDVIEDKKLFDLLDPDCVSPALLTLCDKDAPNRTILCAGAGCYAATHIYETQGIYLPKEQQTPEAIRQNMSAIEDRESEAVLTIGSGQTQKFLENAMQFFAKQKD